MHSMHRQTASLARKTLVAALAWVGLSQTGALADVLKGGACDTGHVAGSINLLIPQRAAPRPKLEQSIQQVSPPIRRYSTGTNSGSFPSAASTRPIPAPRFIPQPAAWGTGTGGGGYSGGATEWGSPPRYIPSLRNTRDYIGLDGSGNSGSFGRRWNHSITPRNGIMTWSPGYTVAAVARPRRSDTSVAYTGRDRFLALTSLRTLPRDAVSGTTTNQTTNALALPPNAVALKAVQYTLPKSAKHYKRASDWNKWYQQFAKAVYSVWTQNEVVIGSSTLQVEVWQGLQLDCKVVEFTPPSDMHRDAKRETQFREAAMRSVRAINGEDLLEFPAMESPPKKIVFEMQFKRAVGGKAGCHVTHAGMSR